MTKIAVILSGCGYLDGAEIHESVLFLLALSQQGCSYHCFAPDIPQMKVVDHLTGKERIGEVRNVLRESARISRGKIQALSDLSVKDFDALILPGGFGTMMNLSDYLTEQEKCQIDPELKRVVLGFFQEKKPIGATCIAPVLLAKIFEGKECIAMTLGSESAWSEVLTRFGMKAESAKISDLVADEKHQIYTCPCYMEPEDLSGAYEGIRKLVKKISNACEKPHG